MTAIGSIDGDEAAKDDATALLLAFQPICREIVASVQAIGIARLSTNDTRVGSYQLGIGTRSQRQLIGRVYLIELLVAIAEVGSPTLIAETGIGQMASLIGREKTGGLDRLMDEVGQRVGTEVVGIVEAFSPIDVKREGETLSHGAQHLVGLAIAHGEVLLGILQQDDPGLAYAFTANQFKSFVY